MKTRHAVSSLQVAGLSLLLAAIALPALAEESKARRVRVQTVDASYSCRAGNDGKPFCDELRFDDATQASFFGSDAEEGISQVFFHNEKQAAQLLGMTGALAADALKNKCVYDGKATLKLGGYAIEEDEGGYVATVILVSVVKASTLVLDDMKNQRLRGQDKCRPVTGGAIANTPFIKSAPSASAPGMPSRVPFTAVFKVHADGSVEPLQRVRYKGMVMGPGTRFTKGVRFNGLDIAAMKTNDISAWRVGELIEIKGFYP